MHHNALLSMSCAAFCSHLFVTQCLPAQQLIVAGNLGSNSGVLSTVDTAPPWPVMPAVATTGADTVVRAFGDRLMVLGRQNRTVQWRQLPGMALARSYAIPQVSAPRDIVQVGPRMALITDHDAAHLWWLDLKTGALTVGQDLTPYADPDGSPDAMMMEVDGDRVYVQLQRYDRNNFVEYGAELAVLAPGFNPNPPVILLHTIDLQGLRPDYRMQRNAAGDRLWISTPGVDGDWGGFAPTGIEEVDLNTGTSLGFMMNELQFGADLGPFVMVNDHKGFAIAHTSIVASTHLRVFDRNVGQLAELHVSINGRLDTIAFAAKRRQIFYPVPGFALGTGGVLVFDADLNTQLSGLLGVGGDPFDMIVAQ